MDVTPLKIAVFAVAALLTGCVTASEIVPMGQGRYMVTGHASGGLNAGKGTIAATQKANAFCAAMNQTALVQTTDFHGMAAVGGESTSLVFSCEH